MLPPDSKVLAEKVTGRPIPDERYAPAPLEATDAQAWRAFPALLKELVGGPG